MHMPGGESTTAFDGSAGWLSFPGRPVHMMNAAENAGAGIDADFYLPVNAKSLRSNWKPAPGETIDGHATNVLVGQTEGQTPLRLYFDAQSGLLVRLIRYTETPLGRLPTQVDYADYPRCGRGEDSVPVVDFAAGQSVHDSGRVACSRTCRWTTRSLLRRHRLRLDRRRLSIREFRKARPHTPLSPTISAGRCVCGGRRSECRSADCRGAHRWRSTWPGSRTGLCRPAPAR